MARTNHIVLRPSGASTVYRKQPLLRPSSRSSSSGRLAEMAGGTAAECAAVWCCCPCTVINLLVLAVYKVPAGICRKALQRRRRRRMVKKGLVPIPASATSSHRQQCMCHGWDSEDFDGNIIRIVPAEEGDDITVVVMRESQVDQDLLQLEEEMWERFYSTGFWRSPSQREQ